MINKFLGWLGVTKEVTTAKDFDRKMPLNRQIRRYQYRVDADMKIWKQAVTMAEDPIRPNRELLYNLYHRIMEDDQLLAQVRNARFNIQMGDFELRNLNGVPTDLVKLFDTPWFFKYIEHCVDTELWGYTVLEPRIGPDGMIREVLLMPREHISPLLRHILIRPSDISGIPWDTPPIEGKLISIGDSDDLGLLKSIAKLIIRKDYNLSDWGRLNERFGIPFVTMKTATRDKKELDVKEEMLANFGASGWALIDDEDEIQIHESKASQQGHKTFEEYSNYADRCIAFLVNGTTYSSEQAAYSGTAQSQERQLNKYTLARMRRIQYHINWELIPFLIKYFNYPLEGHTFAFLDLEYNEEEMAITADNASTEAPDSKPAEKKK